MRTHRVRSFPPDAFCGLSNKAVGNIPAHANESAVCIPLGSFKLKLNALRGHLLKAFFG
jgi:hypothetical protein